MSLPKDFESCQASPPSRKREVTSRRKQDGNPSDEQSPPAKRQKTQTSHKKSGVAHDEGQQFEIKMAAVIGLRGIARGDDFQLSTNKAGYGNFNDLVYTTGKSQYFLQLKHTVNPDTTNLVPSELVPLLHQCLESYCSIIQKPEFKELKSSEFIIYTNKQLGPKLLEHNRQQREIDVIFKTCDTGEIFNFTPHENKEIDVYTGVQKLVKESKEFGDLIPKEQEVKFNMVSKFLEKLIMATGQKGQNGIEDVIIEEIRKFDVVTVDPKYYQTELLHFKKPLESWWRSKKATMTTETVINWLQEAKIKAFTLVVGSTFESCKQKIFGTEIKFSDSEISRLNTELSNKRAVHLRSDALTLCSKLLLDCLPHSKCVSFSVESPQCTKNLLLHAWLGGHWEWLIVFCDSAVQQSVISDTCREISEIITSFIIKNKIKLKLKSNHSTKRVIILTACSVQEIKDFVTIKHEFKFEQLSEESQRIVLDKKIDFQCSEVTMRSVLERHGNVQHVLGPELVTDLITEGTAVNIGGRLQENEDYYAPRVLERKVWLHWDVLRKSNALFAVSGTTIEDLLKIVSSGKTVEFVSLEDINIRDFTQDMRGSIFVLSDTEMERSFLAICKKLEGKTLHWVEFKNGDLLWKKSQGSIESLLDDIDTNKTRADKRIEAEYNYEFNEDSIWDLCERTVLVVAEPGMGKSSTTTQVAWNTKLADPTSWVVRINWNDHTRKLHAGKDEEEFNFDSLVEFLCSAAFPDSKYTDINRILLKQALQNSGNVTVLMDGFDEISPTHADKAAVILSQLMNTKVGRVWVTSRPVEKVRLEKELSVIAFGMKRLSRESQVEMLHKKKVFEASDDKNKWDKFLSRLNESVHDENFTGSPLYITMIATIYKKKKETHLNSEDSRWPEIDLINIYEVFVESKLHIYLTDKQRADTTNSSVLDNLEVLKETLFNKFEKCALVAILPATVLESLHVKKIKEEIQPFLANLQAGKDKTGIVINVVDGKPQFVHRTFAEFFTARWFSRNFKDNRSVMEHILFDRGFKVIADMFNGMLARQFPLHCAVLNRERKRIENLLKEGSDLSDVDNGGRTVMHIFAIKGDLYWDGISLYQNYKVSSDITDSVLQWTPLQYAIKSEDWYIVERLLEINVDRSGLDMIRQRAHEPDYTNPIIINAAQYGYFLLLEFLCNIGVNIHQASDRGFPSPLHAAIQGQQLQVVRLLIQHGADCNTRYSDGKTPLFHAVITGSFEVVRVLVEEGGASVDICDVHGNTVIDEAKRNVQTLQCFCSEEQVENPNKIVEYLEMELRKKHQESCIFI